jgi:uncharacterized membrane protein YfcA
MNINITDSATRVCVLIIVLAMTVLPAAPAWAASDAVQTAWWVWPLALFAVSFVIGIVAVPSGVGGGVLYVPIVSSFFPFHLDFVRGAGLLVAMASALAAGPRLLRIGFADLRLALPPALIASASSIAGALMGLALPAAVVEIALGATILAIAILMWLSRRSEFPQVPRADAWSAALGIGGVYHDAASGVRDQWKVHRTPIGLLIFVAIGVLAGMFGLGAGWANVPTLNLLMGAPLKIAAGTSGFILSIATPAAWVYLNEGALIPIIAVPSVIGMMLGAFLGAHLLTILRGSTIRKLVIVMLLVAGVRTLVRGFGI